MPKLALVDIALMAGALRDIATSVGCPTDVDPLGDLPGLVDAVKGSDQQAKEREIQIASMREQIADLTAQRDRAVETAVYATKAGRSKIDPYNHAAAVFAAYDAGDGDGDRCATAQSLNVDYDFLQSGALTRITSLRSMVAAYTLYALRLWAFFYLISLFVPKGAA